MSIASEHAGFRGLITSADEVMALYGPPEPIVVSKVIDHLDGHCRDFIARAPFVLVATADGAGRCDASPKGGPAGFVEVLDESRLAIPDAPGNRLIDSLRNIIETGRAGLLFLIPGIEVTLRVNGRASLTRDPDVLERFARETKAPKVAIGLEVEEAYLHCAKAFKRSSLWQPQGWPSTDGLAPPAQIWKDHMALPDVTLGQVQDLIDDDLANNLIWR